MLLLSGELTAPVAGLPVGLFVGGPVIGCHGYLKNGKGQHENLHTLSQLLTKDVSPFLTASRLWGGTKAARSGRTWSPQPSVCRLVPTCPPQQKRSATRSVRSLGRQWRRPWATSCRGGTMSSSASSPPFGEARRVISVRADCPRRLTRHMMRHIASPRILQPWRALWYPSPRRRTLRQRSVI